MKILYKDYENACSDGCCQEYGVNLWLDGELIDQGFANAEDAFQYALEQLGHDVEYLCD